MVRQSLTQLANIADYFLDFSDFFGDFLGGPGSGVPNSSRETFLRLFAVSGFWVLLTSVDGRGDPKFRRSIIAIRAFSAIQAIFFDFFRSSGPSMFFAF